MNKIFIISISILSIIIISTIIASSIFAYILYKKYSYLWKIVRRMENDKYLWPLNKKISLGITNYIKPSGNTLLIGVGNCTVLDHLIRKLEPNTKIEIIDSNKYLLDLAKDKYKDRCTYINDDFIYHKFDKCYDNLISTLPHKEFPLNDIEKIFTKYFNVSCENIVYFESKIPHVKNSYVKMLIEDKNKFNDKFIWTLTIKKNYKNIPPVNICYLQKKIIDQPSPPPPDSQKQHSDSH